MRGHLFSGALLLGVAVACGVEVGIDGKACPCGDGYVCDTARDLCVRPEAVSPAAKPACDPCACEKSADCTDSTRPFCDTASKTCVECNPAEDKCPAGSYCNAQFQCTVGCQTSDYCAKVVPDSPLCNVARHQCVKCLSADTCGGKACSPSGTCVESCSEGKPCAGGQACCGGLCLDVTTDPLNCGGCGTTCVSANGAPRCEGGKCAWACANGFAHCGTGNTGCETATRTDVAHCGSCESTCTGIQHVTGLACTAGRCGFGACEQGWDNVDKDALTGCEGKCGAKGEPCCANDKCLDDLVCKNTGGSGSRCNNN